MKVINFVQTSLMIAVACLLVPISMDSCSRRDQREVVQAQYERTIAAADTALAAGRLELAKISYANALRLQPDEQQALNGLVQSQASLILQRRTNVNRAEAYRYIERFESVGPPTKSLPSVQLALGQLYHATGDVKRAKAAFSSILKDSKGFPDGRYAYAVHLIDTGDTKGARLALEMVLDERPDFLAASLTLARLYRDDNRATDAKTVLESQVRFSEKASALLFELGDTLLLLKEHEVAYQRLKKALTVAKNTELRNRILGRLGIAAFLTKRGYEAVKYFEQMPSGGLTPLMRSNLALAYQNLGNHRRAAALLQPLHQKNPFDAGVLMQYMTSLIKLKQESEARKIGTDFLMSAQRIKALAGSAESVRKLMAQIPIKKPFNMAEQAPASGTAR